MGRLDACGPVEPVRSGRKNSNRPFPAGVTRPIQEVSWKRGVASGRETTVILERPDAGLLAPNRPTSGLHRLCMAETGNRAGRKLPDAAHRFAHGRPFAESGHPASMLILKPARSCQASGHATI